MKNPNQQEVLSAILRSDFKAFVRKTFAEVSGASEYCDNWHIDFVCSQVRNMMNGEYNRLVLNIPPRSMKSIIMSIALPAFILGHDPDANIVCVSYADDLAEKLAGDCRNVMESDWYRSAFPNTRIDKARRAVDNFRTTKGGGRFATSTGGVLTGIGAEWIIIDDPMKPIDASSEIRRTKDQEWYRGTLLSRLNDKSKGKIILVQQRLHQDDMSGFVLASDDTYRHIKLPMIAEIDERICITPTGAPPRYIERKVGDLLHPERDSAAIIEKLRTDLGEYVFAGQYQQRPVPAEGGVIKERWLNFYDHNPNRKFQRVIMSWDTASKTGTDNAYSACITIGVGHDNKFYILDVFRKRLELPDLVEQVRAMYYVGLAKYSVYPEIVVESASSGIGLVQYLKSHSISVSEVKPESDKTGRLMGISTLISDGTCKFPSFPTGWWTEFRDELLTFPAAKFKDQCDALSQGIGFAVTTIGKSPPLIGQNTTHGGARVFDRFDKNRTNDKGKFVPQVPFMA